MTDLNPARPHGRAKYVAKECDCIRCRSANARYQTERNRDKVYGRERMADAAPVRTHLQALQAAGMGRRRITELSGVTESVVSRIIYGKHGKPVQRVRHATAQALLALRADLDTLADHVPVDGTGTQRRLRALIAIGWTQAELGRRINVSPNNFTGLVSGPARQVTARRARQVRDLYRTLAGAVPPHNTPRQRAAVDRARAMAAARGWLSPIAWDGDQIDQPDARPARGGARA